MQEIQSPKHDLDEDAANAGEIHSRSKVPRIPPAGFDPLIASTKDLLQYGYPPRPNKDKQPELRAKWESMLSKLSHIIIPQPKIPDLPRRTAIQ